MINPRGRAGCTSHRNLPRLSVARQTHSLSGLRRQAKLFIALLGLVGQNFCILADEKQEPVPSASKPQQNAVRLPWQGDIILEFDFRPGKREEFVAECKKDQISFGYYTAAGQHVWNVSEDHWPKACRLAQRLQIPTITPREGIPVGDSICVVSASAFRAGQWNSAFNSALDTLIDNNVSYREPDDSVRELTIRERSIPDVKHTLLECHHRSVNAAKGLKLPTIQEWAQIQISTSRMHQIAYLGERISLCKGVLNDNGLIVPECILDVARQKKLVGPSTEIVGEIDRQIDPFQELLMLQISDIEVSQLFPYFTVNWTFLPKNNETIAGHPLHSASRYCLCVVINDVFKRLNMIREYDLTDTEWQDVKAIAALVQTRCTDPKENVH